MAKFLLVTACLSLLAFSAASAQQSGTEQERRACAGNVQSYCRLVLDQGDLAVLACLQQNREKLNVACKKVLTDHGQ